MDPTLPHAKSAPPGDNRDAIKRLIAQRGLCGLANDTKWDELIDAMRARAAWRPSYRYKCVDGPPSAWDVEWFYHLPFPLISVEWLDVAFITRQHTGQLTPPQVIDHSAWIEALLQRIGLDYRKGRGMIRIFGYAPRRMELFDE